MSLPALKETLRPAKSAQRSYGPNEHGRIYVGFEDWDEEGWQIAATEQVAPARPNLWRHTVVWSDVFEEVATYERPAAPLTFYGGVHTIPAGGEIGKGWLKEEIISQFVAAATVKAEYAKSELTSPWERAILELWELADGQDDPPARTVLQSIERMLPTIRALSRMPDFETHDDGAVTLRWLHENQPRSFAIHFGRKSIVAVYSQPLHGPGFGVELNPSDVAGIERALQRGEIADLVAK